MASPSFKRLSVAGGASKDGAGAKEGEAEAEFDFDAAENQAHPNPNPNLSRNPNPNPSPNTNPNPDPNPNQAHLGMMALKMKVSQLERKNRALRHRSMIILVGDNGREQVVNLHYMLSKATVRARPSVLWCYKKELGFSTHRKKRMKAIKKQIARGLHDATDEPFELFISQTDIRWCYYRDTHKILGATYGTLVLQDFEALTPNLLARTIETVEGGGLVVVLLRTVTSLKQLYAMSMDVHARFRGSATRGECVPRFNERFILSLADCRRCLVLDDELNVLPLSRKHVARFEDAPPDAPPPPSAAVRAEIEDLAATLADAPPAGELVAKAHLLLYKLYASNHLVFQAFALSHHGARLLYFDHLSKLLS